MKKRILAGVLALLMVASAMPLSDFADFVPDMSVTASAQDNENDFKPFSGKVEKDGKEIVNVPGILALPGLLAAPIQESSMTMAHHICP